MLALGFGLVAVRSWKNKRDGSRQALEQS